MPSADARRAAPTGFGSSSAVLTSFAAFSSWRWPREFASAPSRRFASGYSCDALRSSTLRAARASLHVQRARICSGASALALADRAEQRADPREAVLLPRRRLGDERDEVVEVGAVDLHRHAVGERDHPQPPVRVLGGARGQELLERALRRATVGELLDEIGALLEADLPAGDRRPEALLVVVEVLRVDALPLALDHARGGAVTSGVTGTSHGAGVSLRCARRWIRRRGAGVTRAPSR